MIAAILGGGFGALFRQQAGYAPAVGTGIVYGLLCWIALPLTLVPLIQGHAPGWSLAEASAVFPAPDGPMIATISPAWATRRGVGAGTT